MSADAFQLLSLTARYVFTGLMLLIVIRAARGALVDSRRAAKLRRLSPMTGLSGELVVLDAVQRIPRGMRYPVIREGMIGSSRRADIRIRHSTVRRRHILFQLTESGLHIRTHAGAKLRDALGAPARELTLLDGDSFSIGDIRLLLVLSVPDLPRRPVRTEYADNEHPDDDLFDVNDWSDEENHSDPVSPIFERDADPYDDPPLYTRSRDQRTRRPQTTPTRRASGSDPVSPIFDTESRANPPRTNPRRPSNRAFLDEDDDLFKTNDKF